MFKPMKPPSGVLEDSELHLLRFPLIGSPKIDGIRATVQEGYKILSSTLKPIPNKHIRALFDKAEYQNFDGELTVGSLVDGKCFARTTSVVMSDDNPIDGLQWNVFDYFMPWNSFEVRHCKLCLALPTDTQYIKRVQQVLVNNLAEFLDFEKKCVDGGYEGAMYRNPLSFYKCGRSTKSELELVRRKPFSDAEAIITGTFEQMENMNAAYINEAGHTKRSSCAAGKIGKGTLGGFYVRGLTAFKDVDFKINAFGTDVNRKELWDMRESLPGKILRYKYQKYGSKDAPRIPIALGFRDREDISDE